MTSRVAQLARARETRVLAGMLLSAGTFTAVTAATAPAANAYVCPGHPYDCTDPNALVAGATCSQLGRQYQGRETYVVGHNHIMWRYSGWCRTIWGRTIPWGKAPYTPGTFMTRTDNGRDTHGLAILGPSPDQWTKQVHDLGTLGYSCAWQDADPSEVGWVCTDKW